MTVNDLLEHPILTLPQNWRTTDRESYYLHIVRTGKEYLKLLESLEAFEVDGRSHYMGQIPNTVFIYETVRNLYQALFQGIQRYFNQGSPSAAYTKFDSFFALKEEQSRMFSPDSYLTSLTLSEQHIFYRLRYADCTAPNARGMFHIPFESRRFIRTQRFSISGYPCLYAASSVYLAYQELRAPGWTPHLYATKLKAVSNQFGQIRLLDLRNHVEEMRQRHLGRPNSYDGRLMRFLVTWLLSMATSVPTSDADNFHEEYLVPQLVLEWVNSTRNEQRKFFNGIAFSSSRVSTADPAYLGAFNIVLPVDQSYPKGLCNVLTQQLRISEPITVNDLVFTAGEATINDEQLAQRIQEALDGRDFVFLRPTEESAPIKEVS